MGAQEQRPNEETSVADMHIPDSLRTQRSGALPLEGARRRTRARRWLAAGFAAAGLLAGQFVRAEPIPPGWSAENMEPIGFTSLSGRYGAFKMSIRQVDGRWYLYTGHTFDQGWSIIDVTDPRDPKHVKFIPWKAPQGWITSQLTVAGNLMVTSLNSFKDRNPADGGILIWDVSKPTEPQLLSHFQTGPQGTHRNNYPGGKYIYLSTSLEGYDGYIMMVVDISDPRHPKEAGRYWTPGQKAGEPKQGVPPSFHGPVNMSPDGRMASMPFTPSVINLDMSDVSKPKLIGSLQFTPPFNYVDIQSIHTVLPIWDRKLLFASSEARASGCDREALNFAAMIDNKDPAKPRLISMFPVPRPAKGLPYRDFCDKGGRFGPHNTNQQIHLPDVEKPGNLIYIAYFNAGLRVFDISNPRLPTETGWFLPPERPDLPDHEGSMHSSPVNWTEEVLVDTRGNIFIADNKWGVFVLRYKGEGQPAPTAR
jgi:hypothetical protein